MGTFTAADFTGTKWINRITGQADTIYLDPNYGDDRNDGHPKRPVGSWNAARALGGINALIIVAPGTLAEQSPQDFYGELRGDSKKPVIDGTLFTTYANSLVDRFLSNNLEIKNFIALYRGGSTNAQFLKIKNCKLINIAEINLFSTYGEVIYQNNTAINCFQAGTTSASYIPKFFICNKNTFINAKFMFKDDIKVLNCIFDTGSEILFNTTQPTTFDYLNVQGLIEGQSLLNYKIANPTALPNSLAVNPAFNNEAMGDYSLSPLSALLHAGSDGLQIGAIGLGHNTSGQSGYTAISNAEWDTDHWKATDPAQVAIIESEVKDHGEALPIERIEVFAEEDELTLQHVDESLPYDPTDITSGNIVEGESYLVFNYDSVTYNGEIYLKNQVFVGVNGVDTFATAGAGSVYKITEFPDQRIVLFRTSAISAADLALQSYQRYIIGKGIIVDGAGVAIGEPNHDWDDQQYPPVAFSQHRIHLLSKT